MCVLVAEDDAPLADFLRQRLVQEQFAVQHFIDWLKGYSGKSPDSIPGGGGRPVCR
jgi:DNA-binding response OmpR family regulator